MSSGYSRPPSRKAIGIRSSRKQKSSYIDMQWLATLNVPVNFGIDGMMEEGQTGVLLVNVRTRIDYFLQRGQVFHLNCSMRHT
jgi:hypothetical protein